MKSKLFFVFSILTIFTVLFTGCQPTASVDVVKEEPADAAPTGVIPKAEQSAQPATSASKITPRLIIQIR